MSQHGARQRPITWGLWVTAIVVWGGGCTKDDGGPERTCQETICEPGTEVCFGSYEATCLDDGKGYRRTHCGSTARCVAGDCVALGVEGCRVGTRVCQSSAAPWKVDVCAPDGSAYVREICPADQYCDGGLCLPERCADGQAACGWLSGWRNLLFLCNAEHVWYKSECPNGQVCKEGAGCVVQECEAGQTECVAAASLRRCTVGGVWGPSEPCGLGEFCYGGLCLPEVCGVVPDVPPEPDAAPDAGAPDAGSNPDASPSSDVAGDGATADVGEVALARVVMDGQEVVFTSNLDAQYIEAAPGVMQDLKITMDRGSEQLELHFVPIPVGQTGQFSSAAPGGVAVHIVYNDGTYFSPAGGLAAFPWAATEYEVVLTAFGDVAGWVEGTFSGLLQDQVHEAGGDRPNIVLTEGQFRVRRSQ